MDEKQTRRYRLRLRALFAIFILCAALFTLTLYDAQVLKAADYYKKSSSGITTSEKVEASRGIITDRNGKVLVSNRQVYTITFDSSLLKKDQNENDAIWRLLQLCEEYDVTWNDTLPITTEAPYSYTTPTVSDTTRKRFQSFLAKLGWSEKELTAEDPYPYLTAKAAVDIGVLNRRVTAQELLEMLRAYFKIDPALSLDDARKLIGIRYELALRSSGSTSDAYILAEDVDSQMISLLNDGDYAGVVVGTKSVRQYETDYAAHILGRITQIYPEDKEEIEGKGYDGDDLIGRDGVEKAFEEYLRGTDGKRYITTNEDGKITGEVYSTEPQPGNTVSLTIDIDFQAQVEQALAEAVEKMNEEEARSHPERLDRGAAAAVVEIGTGDVLALASYPTYSLSTYNKDYNDLLQDERSPMLNRALNGRYAPGSTFKMCTATAALETGVITPSTTILTKGIYTYYAPSYTPKCWIYTQSHRTHGRINVSKAITESCNYFFSEVGRLTGIDALNEYGTALGLGQPTGIELPEFTGILDGEAYRESVGQVYNPGDTLQIAIGQGGNLFHPLQLANYVATILSGGTRYETHLLNTVKTYDGSAVVVPHESTVASSIDLSGSTIEAIKKGMGDLVESGSVSSYFRDCIVSAGAKTGSAQVGTDVANGIFVAFAPFDNPEIVVSVVIEKGGSGSALASTAVKILNAWFSQEEIGTAVIGENTLLP